MKFAFVTCVQLGLSCMEEIYRSGGKLDLVITLRDDIAAQKSGRIYVDEFCSRHNIPVVKVKNVNDDQAIHAVRENGIDWLFIIGWSQIARLPALQAPRRGALGMHPTLLPVGRGRASIPWAIIKNLPETGVTLFQLDEGVDTGPILAQERLPLAADETATGLYQRVDDAHRALIHRVWPTLVDDSVQLIPQDDAQSTCWPGRKPEDGLISAGMTVEVTEALVRATTHPYPGAFWQEEKNLIRIWRGTVGNATEAPPSGAKRFTVSNGVYDALDYQIESLEDAG